MARHGLVTWHSVGDASKVLGSVGWGQVSLGCGVPLPVPLVFLAVPLISAGWLWVWVLTWGQEGWAPTVVVLVLTGAMTPIQEGWVFAEDV